PEAGPEDDRLARTEAEQQIEGPADAIAPIARSMNAPGVEYTRVAGLELDPDRSRRELGVPHGSLEHAPLFRRIGARVRARDVLEMIVVRERDPESQERRARGDGVDWRGSAVAVAMPRAVVIARRGLVEILGVAHVQEPLARATEIVDDRHDLARGHVGLESHPGLRPLDEILRGEQVGDVRAEMALSARRGADLLQHVVARVRELSRALRSNQASRDEEPVLLPGAVKNQQSGARPPPPPPTAARAVRDSGLRRDGSGYPSSGGSPGDGSSC